VELLFLESHFYDFLLLRNRGVFGTAAKRQHLEFFSVQLLYFFCDIIAALFLDTEGFVLYIF
jgi:hypothetical protein